MGKPDKKSQLTFKEFEKFFRRNFQAASLVAFRYLNDPNIIEDMVQEQPIWMVGQKTKDCFIQIGQSIKNGDSKFQDSKIKILTNEILIQLLELFTYEKPVLNDSLIQSQRSVEIFLENLKSMLSEQWSLSEMADYCGLGTTQFSKYCYKLTNATPMNYLTQLRLNQASLLLQNEPKKTITEISYECGFSSNQYSLRYSKSDPNWLLMSAGLARFRND